MPRENLLNRYAMLRRRQIHLSHSNAVCVASFCCLFVCLFAVGFVVLMKVSVLLLLLLRFILSVVALTKHYTFRVRFFCGVCLCGCRQALRHCAVRACGRPCGSH